MPNRLNHQPGGGIVHKMLAGASSVGAGTEFDLLTPLSEWSMQVVTASTDAIATMDLSLQSSSGATFETKLTWATTGGQASGDIVSVSSTPAQRVRAALSAGGSSNGMDIWVAGV